MPIHVDCPCGKKLIAPDEAAGQKVQCPHCKRIMDVPGPSGPTPDTTIGHQPLAAPAPPPTRPFFEEVGRAFVYPITGHGLWVLVFAALLRSVAGIFAYGIITVVATMLIMVFLGLYLSSYFLAIVQSSAGGEAKPPGLPDASDLWDDILKPFFLILWAALVSAAPQVIYVAYAVIEEDVAVNPMVLTFMSVWSSLYFPMAVMSVAVWRSFAAVFPHVVVPAILRIPGQHLMMAGMVWLTWQGYRLAVSHLAAQLRSAGIVGELAGTFVPFLLLVYFSWVIARIIGITHWTYRKRIGWFRTI